MDLKSVLIGILIGAVLFGGGAFVLLDNSAQQNPEEPQNNDSNLPDQSKYKNFTETQRQSVLGPYASNITTDTSYVTIKEVKDRYLVRADSSVTKFYTTSSRTDSLIEYDSGTNETYVVKSSRSIGLVVETNSGQRYLAAIFPSE